MIEFVRYYDGDKLRVISISELKNLIKSDSNKSKIADIVYERIYNRYLKIFLFEGRYSKCYELNNGSFQRDVFKQEFKNGFLMMACSSLLIETMAAFLSGQNTTPNGQAKNAFNCFFLKAKEYNNDLYIFHNTTFYKDIRCGILHQAETYGKFRISREGGLFSQNRTINASLFIDCMKQFIDSYRTELKTAEWDSDIWKNCRKKIEFIIKNVN